MAYEQLDKFTDTIAERYKKTQNESLIMVLADYYSTALSHSKFKAQREHCKMVIKELSPSFYQGFFKK